QRQYCEVHRKDQIQAANTAGCGGLVRLVGSLNSVLGSKFCFEPFLYRIMDVESEAGALPKWRSPCWS
ncbi:MAG: hypothetical protein O3B68_18480, partial [Planctomycetota bacterium]|nr:hypothetical protein [Planctomycetota bacterium]